MGSRPPETIPTAERVVGIVASTLGVMAIVVITLTPASGDSRIAFWCMTCGERPSVDALLNVLLFVPFAFGLGVLGVPAKRVILAGLLITGLIELLQLLVIPGRYPSARDIVANTVGTAIGHVVGYRWRTLVIPAPRGARVLLPLGCLVWVTMQAFTAWAMGAAPPPPPWWAQFQPEQDRYPAVVGGTLLDVSIGDLGIPWSDSMVNATAARALLSRGAPLQVIATRVEPTPGPAPLVIISAGAVHDVVRWAIDGDDGMFAATIRGTLLGLRTPWVRIQDVLPTAPGDTFALSGSYVDGRYRLRASVGDEVRVRELGASPSATWALVLPLPMYAFGPRVRVVTMLWLGLVWTLLGYWAGRAAGDRHAPFAIGTGSGALILGLLIVPISLALPPAHWSEWAASIGAAAIGATMATLLEPLSTARRS